MHSVKGGIIEVDPYAIQLLHINLFGSMFRYKPQLLSEGGIYDCIYTASWGYYLRAASIKTVATINQ